MSDHAPDLDTTHARQATSGRDVLVVLIVSLALAIIALLAVWAYFSGDLKGLYGNQEAPPQVARRVSAVQQLPARLTLRPSQVARS